jgi:hypothetical protein
LTSGNSEPAKTEAHQFSAAGWTLACIGDLRSVLALRVDATLNLESHDWMFLTSCQPIIDALAKLRAYAHDRNTAWSSQGSLTAAEGQRRAQQERLAWRELAEALVAELHELSQPLAKRACEAPWKTPPQASATERCGRLTSASPETT